MRSRMRTTWRCRRSIRGDTDKVRQLEAHAPVRPQNKSLLLALAIGRTVVG
jgi:hypothetical protein